MWRPDCDFITALIYRSSGNRGELLIAKHRANKRRCVRAAVSADSEGSVLDSMAVITLGRRPALLM